MTGPQLDVMELWIVCQHTLERLSQPAVQRALRCFVQMLSIDGI